MSRIIRFSTKSKELIVFLYRITILCIFLCLCCSNTAQAQYRGFRANNYLDDIEAALNEGNCDKAYNLFKKYKKYEKWYTIDRAKKLKTKIVKCLSEQKSKPKPKPESKPKEEAVNVLPQQQETGSASTPVPSTDTSPKTKTSNPQKNSKAGDGGKKENYAQTQIKEQQQRAQEDNQNRQYGDNAFNDGDYNMAKSYYYKLHDPDERENLIEKCDNAILWQQDKDNMSKGDAAFNAGNYYDAIVFYKKVEQYNLEEAAEKVNKSREKILDQQRKEFYFEVEAAKECLERCEYEEAKKHYLKVAKYSSTGFSAEIAECEKKIQKKQAIQKVLDTKRCPFAPSVTDYDGNIYRTVQIGPQCWMAENLRTTHYPDGTSILLSNDSASIHTPYRYYPNGKAYTVDLHGYLYNWAAAMGGAENRGKLIDKSSSESPSGVQGICPNGWHIPSFDEWTILYRYVYRHFKRLDYTLTPLKSNELWDYSQDEDTVINITGFSALPSGGFIYDNKKGWHYVFKRGTDFWSSTTDKTKYDLYVYTPFYYSYSSGQTPMNWIIKSQSLSSALSIRCVHDSIANQKINDKTCGIVTDYDGNTYNTVQIGEQCWMRENLRTTHYADGKKIKQLSLPNRKNHYKLSKSPGYYQIPNSNNPQDVFWYNWYATMHTKSAKKIDESEVQGVCPDGWHIPSYDEWKLLEDYINNQTDWGLGSDAKALASQFEWKSKSSKDISTPGKVPYLNNESGFTALPIGCIISNGERKGFASFWTYKFYANFSEIRPYRMSIESEASRPSLSYDRNSINGCSVRCIRD